MTVRRNTNRPPSYQRRVNGASTSLSKRRPADGRPGRRRARLFRNERAASPAPAQGLPGLLHPLRDILGLPASEGGQILGLLLVPFDQRLAVARPGRAARRPAPL